MPRPPGAVASEYDREMGEDYIGYCHANALLDLLDAPLPG